jgi:hypothetical protein
MGDKRQKPYTYFHVGRVRPQAVTRHCYFSLGYGAIAPNPTYEALQQGMTHHTPIMA